MSITLEWATRVLAMTGEASRRPDHAHLGEHRHNGPRKRIYTPEEIHRAIKLRQHLSSWKAVGIAMGLGGFNLSKAVNKYLEENVHDK